MTPPHRAMSLAFVLPYGEPRDGFFPDTLLGQLCGLARERGHRGSIARVYYDGGSSARDREVARRLEAWLAELYADVVVVDRLFDPDPIVAHISAAPGRHGVFVWRGDSFEPVAGMDLVVGLSSGVVPGGRTRRTPTFDELGVAFVRLLDALGEGADPLGVPGVSAIRRSVLVHGPVSSPPRARLPYRPVLDQHVICLESPPRVVRGYLFGDAGCPYGRDPARSAHLQAVPLPDDQALARLGCSFCCMGGDYQTRAVPEVVEAVLEQASYLVARNAALEELVLGDQYPVRYLKPLLAAASSAGMRPVRWLFAARSDALLRDLDRIEDAIRVAVGTGHSLELYLTGFEAFADRELDRYNKGLDVAVQLAAIATMRRLAGSYPGAFQYQKARGHSLILWNPWTSPEDLRESVRHIRRHGLLELFHELGRNRLRLHRDLPISYAAERDGALVSAWEEGDEGAARRKGYNPEHPWRFLDPRTRLAHGLASRLRERLGTETELAQLSAVVDSTAGQDAASDVPETVGRVLEEVDRLERSLAGLLPGVTRTAQDPPCGSGGASAAVLFAGECNNGCVACANRDTWLDDAPSVVFARVREARKAGRGILLAGREPTMHPAFLEALARARGPDERPVGVVTNGRRFCYGAFSRSAVRAGLAAASVKIFAARPAEADAISRVEGGFEQAVEGIRRLRAAGLAAIELRIGLDSRNLSSFADVAELALTLGVGGIRVEAALDAVSLAHLGAAAAAVSALAERCAKLGVPLEASPLSAGTRDFRRMPLPRLR